MHSITTLSPATTVVFSGAAMMVTSPPAGWEPKAEDKKRSLFLQTEKLPGKQRTPNHPSHASPGCLTCVNSSCLVGGEKQVLSLCFDEKITKKCTEDLF